MGRLADMLRAERAAEEARKAAAAPPVADEVEVEETEEDPPEEDEQTARPETLQRDTRADLDAMMVEAEQQLEAERRAATQAGIRPSTARTTTHVLPAEDTVRRLEGAIAEAALTPEERAVTAFQRRAKAQAPEVWQEKLEPLAETLGIPFNEFGSPISPNFTVVDKVLQQALQQPDNTEIRESVKYLANDLELFGDVNLVTDQTYQEILPNLATTERRDFERTMARAQMGGRTAVVATTPRTSGAALFKGQPGDAVYTDPTRRLADTVSRITETKDYNKLTKALPNLLGEVALVSLFAGQDTEMAERAVRHGALAREYQERHLGKEIPVEFVPMQDQYGTSLDFDAFKLAAYVQRYLELREQGVEPDPQEIIEGYSEALQDLEMSFLNAGVPVYNADPTKMLEASLAVSLDADEEEPWEGYGSFVAKELAQGGTPLRRVRAAVFQQFVPAEFKSGYVTLNGQQIRVAQDRFVESVGGRNSASSTADYVLSLATVEVAAKPYVLTLDRLRREHPDEPVDGLAIAHPLEASLYYYKYLGSDATVLDKAVTDTHLAELMVTVGRSINPAIPATRYVLGAPEDKEPGLVRTLQETNEAWISMTSALSGAAVTMVVMARDPLDATDAVLRSIGGLGKGVVQSPAVKDALASINAATRAMEESTNAGVRAGLASLQDTEDGQKAYEAIARHMGGAADYRSRPLFREGERSTRAVPLTDYSGATILDAAMDADFKLRQAGEAPFVVDALLRASQKYATAAGLDAVVLAAKTESALHTSGRVSDTAPVHQAAQEASRRARKAQVRIGELRDQAKATLDDIEFNKVRRDEYDARLDEFARAAQEKGSARIGLDQLDNRLAAVNAQAKTERALKAIADSILTEAGRKKALETLLAALGDVRKAADKPIEAVRAKDRDVLNMYIAPFMDEGDDFISTIRRLQEGTSDDQALAVRLRDEFYGYYEDAAFVGVDVKSAREADIDALRARRKELETQFDGAQVRMQEARANLAKAADAVLESSPRSTRRKMSADTRRTQKAGGPVKPSVLAETDVEGTVLKGTPSRPAKRAKLTALFDDIEDIADVPSRRAQERLGKRKTKEAKKKRRTTKKDAESLEAQEAAQDVKVRVRAEVAVNLDVVEERARRIYYGQLRTLFRALEETAALRAARNSGFADLSVLLDGFRRGKYGPRSLAEVINTEMPRVSARYRDYAYHTRQTGAPDPRLDPLYKFWEQTGPEGFERLIGPIQYDTVRAEQGRYSFDALIPTRPDALELSRDAERKLQSIVDASRFYFDPVGAAGRAQYGYTKARAFLVSGSTRFLELTHQVLLDKTVRFAAARFVDDVYTFFGELVPEGAGTDIAKAVARVNQQAARRQETVDADFINIDRAVEEYARQQGLSTQETLDLLADSQRMYLTRNYVDLAASPIFTFGGEGSAVKIKGPTELAEGTAVGTAQQVLVGATDKVARGLSRTTSATQDVVEHLMDIRRVWQGRTGLLNGLTDLDVGQFILTLVKSQVREGQSPASAGAAVDAFVQKLVALDKADPLFRGNAAMQYARLYELVRSAMKEEAAVLAGAKSRAEFARIMADGSVYARAFKDIARAQVGVTARQGQAALKALTRGAGPEQAPYLETDLFKLRNVSYEDLARGDGVYVAGDLVEASNALQPFRVTEATKYDPATGRALGLQTLPEASPFTADRIPVAGKPGTYVADPEVSGALSYKYLGLDPADKKGKTAIIETYDFSGNVIERRVPVTDLQRVPPMLEATDTMTALARLGVVRPLDAEELGAGMQRLVVFLGDDETPRYLIKQQVDYISTRLANMEKNFQKIVNKEAQGWLDPRNMGASLFQSGSAFIASGVLYGVSPGRRFHSSGRALRSALDDSMSAMMVEGNDAGLVVLMAGLRAVNKGIEEGRILAPSGLPFIPFLPGRVGAVVLRSLATSAKSSRIASVLPIPDDLTLLLDGPLRYLEDTNPNRVFEYRGKRLKGPDGRDKTVGEVYEELETAGVYDTFHTQARDALLLDETRKLRLDTETRDPTWAQEVVENLELPLEEYRARITRPAARQVADVTNEVGTEQRAALYLYKRFRGSTPKEAEDALDMSLLNWTELSPLGNSAASAVVLFARAKYQGMKQAARVWGRAIGGKSDEDRRRMNAFVQHQRLRERVLPYVAETYFGTEAPVGGTTQARRDYYATLQIMRELQQDWEDPYAYVLSRPYSPEEKARLDAMAPGLSNLGFNQRLLTRGNYDDMSLPYYISDLGVRMAVAASGTELIGAQPLPGMKEFGEGLLGAAHDELNPFTGAILDAMAGKQSYGSYSKPGLRGYDLLLADMGLVATDAKTPKGTARGEVKALKTVTKVPFVFEPFTKIFYRDGAKTYAAMQNTEMYINILLGNASIETPGVASLLQMVSPDAADAYRRGPKEYMEDGRHREELTSAYLRYLSLYAKTNRGLLMRTREVREDSVAYENDLRAAHLEAIRQALLVANAEAQNRRAARQPLPEEE